MNKCLIIDSYGFIFRAFHVQPDLTSPDGAHVGAIYGFTSMLIKLLIEHNPSNVIAVFDTGGKTFRHNIYSKYKANRPPAPESLVSQFPLARNVANALGIYQIEKAGLEADDVIASLAESIAKSGNKAIIVSADKDLAQLMSENIEIFDPIKGITISCEQVYDKIGVMPSRIRDFLALTGDSSDNIPGVPGFGPKTAAELISQFGSFENICANFQQISSVRKRDLFAENIEKAKLSYELAGLKIDESIKFNELETKWQKPSRANLIEFLNKYGFKSLHNRAAKIWDDTTDNNLINKEDTKALSGYIELKTLKEDIRKFGYCGIMIQSDGFIIISCEGKICKLERVDEIQDLIQNIYIQKITPSAKLLLRHFDQVNAYDDISIMAYLLSSASKEHSPEELFIQYTEIELPEDNDSKAQEICRNIKYLRDELKQELFNQNLLGLYLGIDLPLAKILDKMEKYGVLVDVAQLHKISKEYEGILDNVSKVIFTIAQKEFNINSPKQLGDVLFDELKLPGSKKTGKTQALSTSAEVLEDLAARGYEIAKKLLYWRQISKLKSTYADALPKLINKETNRLHTTFSQITTTTGRLTSNNPNLQNIPVRTEEGAKIRNTIIAPAGYKLICADYSQVELRILAEIADIDELKNAFAENVDIHAKTASQIFGVKLGEVTGELRRKAKAINFGIIYGISAFGLASRLNITQQEASNYIQKYFATYPGIKEYMDRTKDYAKTHGFVINHIGRRCYIPQIASGSFLERNFAERAAINAPIQGYAADIIKLAMIEIDKDLANSNCDCKMILQIHDELIFECLDKDVDIIAPKIKTIMENIVTFTPQLKINLEILQCWC
ncbi:MAG: DNA polymerase I [Rickettsiaceae bacterium]|nr:DNA polymerase I [Rickettsiaceae bacterium]